MCKKWLNRHNDHHWPQQRKGAVAVEFAVVAPMLLAIVVGLLELSRVYDVQNMIESAAREGARFAATDRSGMMQEGQTANQKLAGDVLNLLSSSGIPTADIQVSIRDPENPCVEFDLDNSGNGFRLFEVHVEIPYSAISYTPVSQTDDYSLSSSVTFRNGRAPSTQ